MTKILSFNLFFAFTETVNNNSLKHVMSSAFKLAPVKDFVLFKSGFLFGSRNILINQVLKVWTCFSIMLLN